MQRPHVHRSLGHTHPSHLCVRHPNVCNAQLWDNLFGSVYDKPCFCTECSRGTPARSRDAFAKIELPDYSVLLKPSFWLNAKGKAVAE